MFDISTYLNRITSQHKTKPKYMALLAARLQPFIDLAECLESFDAAFDLDNAVGKQLDTVGEYAGVKRLLDFQPQIESPVLQDHYYRMLIKAKISLNNWDGTVEGIGRILGDVFPQYTVTVVDKQDMTLNVQIAGLESLFEGELITNGYITPKPMGVLVDYYFVFSIEVDTTLYIGGLAHERVHNRGLPAPPPPEDNIKPTGDLYIAGRKSENLVSTTATNKPPSTEVDVENAKLFAAGVKAIDFIGKEVYGKPPPSEIVVEPEQIYAAGTTPSNVVGATAQSKPPSAEIEPPLIDDYTYAGLLSSKRINAAIAEKPAMSAFDTLRVAAYEGGVKAVSTLRYALPSAPI